jgi:hypothetical protein
MTLPLPLGSIDDFATRGMSNFTIDGIAKDLCSIQDLKSMNRRLSELSVNLQRPNPLKSYGEIECDSLRYLRWVYLLSINRYHTAKKLFGDYLQASLPVELVEMIKKNVPHCKVSPVEKDLFHRKGFRSC